MQEQKQKLTIAIVSPGKFSVPPVIGTSVEHDIEMVANVLKKKYHIIIYTRRCSEYPVSSKEGNLEYRRFTYQNGHQYLQQVIKDLTKLNPNIIQVENRPQYVSRIKKTFPHIPLILNMHSMLFATPPQITVKQANQVMGLIDIMITNSRYLQHEYERKFPVLKGKTYGIHLGIDPYPYVQAKNDKKIIERLKNKYGIKRDDKVLLFVGRVKADKGVHHIINALPNVIKQHKNIKLLIVGSPKYGNDKKTHYFRKLKHDSRPFKKHVIFTKFIKPNIMPYIYQLADVVVTPSVWKEPFCRVNLEAMSASKPIVTTKQGGIPEVVKDKKDGYVIPLKDLSLKLPDTLNKLLSSVELRQRMGSKGLLHAKDFTWEKTVDEYLNVYNKVVNPR